MRKFKAACKGSNITVLENDLVRIGDVEFFGATLWTDLNLLGRKDFELQSYQLTQEMHDYRKIKYRSVSNYRKLRPMDTLGIHNSSMSWLKESLRLSDAKRKVVITHHAPSARSLSPKYKSQVTSLAYASNLESFIAEHEPNLWVHGHVHASSDYELAAGETGRCRVLCNPRGYDPNGLNPGFDESCKVEI